MQHSEPTPGPAHLNRKADAEAPGRYVLVGLSLHRQGRWTLALTETNDGAMLAAKAPARPRRRYGEGFIWTAPSLRQAKAQSCGGRAGKMHEAPDKGGSD